ncbi:SHOCT domain-containing protein [Desulfitobacterium metallireducens]|uniref:SHOCT domain-containing protein n=1 Tax=Desulfitobacterium metallireducens DSM 15288 TaxID=871968 RepID=W0EFV8_9FIRM|nr:SHOCT domain-containing protein [Desulfitobacterium metallireducens]AHF08398.1 hypothetical protein DESME_01895 [Desulfitobacterium metallireducens DSM 15288]
MFIVLLILIIGAVYLFRQQDQHTSGGLNNSLEILRQRYARGEIDEMEFKARKNILEQ